MYLEPSPAVAMELFLEKKLTVFSSRKQSQEVFYKKVALKNLQNPQENICDTAPF